MGPFETKCPRCVRLGEKAAQAPSEPEEPKEALATRVKTAAQDTASQFQAVPLIKLPKVQVEEPELGWTLTVALWIVIGLDGLLTAGLFIAGLITSGGSIFIALFSALGPGVCLVGAIGILRSQRWGFWLFSIFAVVPVILQLLFNGVGWLISSVTGLLVLFLVVLPSLIIFFLCLGKWDELE